MAIIMVFLCLASSSPQRGGDYPPDQEEMGCFGDQESCVKDCAACPNGLGDEELCRESCADDDEEGCWTWDLAWKPLGDCLGIGA